jgi:hypothetical protein
MRADGRIAIRLHNERAWLAWHTAALPMTKKFPALKKLQRNPDDERPHWQRQLDELKAWVVATGGKIVKKPKA